MRIIKIVLGIGAAYWTIATVVGVVKSIGKSSGTMLATDIAIGIGLGAAGSAITLWLFQSALRKTRETK